MWRAPRSVGNRTLRMLAALLVLSVLSTTLVGAGAPVVRAQTDGIDPFSLLISGEDAGAVATMTKESHGEDGQSRWAQRQWERDRESPDATTGPLVIVNTVYVARDLTAAQQVYAAEVAKSPEVPEAMDRRTGSYAFPMMRIGDESAALSVCDDCNAKDEIYVHHRAVIRKGPVVTVMYTYGTDGVATQDLATWFAGQAAGRIPDDLKADAPAGPASSPADEGAADPPTGGGAGTNLASAPPATGAPTNTALPSGAAIQARPHDLAVKLSEAGKNAEMKDEKDGSDDRSDWYLVRYERPRNFAGYRAGPVTVVSQVYVARSRAAAEQILQDQVKRNEEFPESSERIGGRFELKTGGGIGDESRGLAACSESCNSRRELYLHQRIVSRVENVVSVVYVWGLDNVEGVTEESARYFSAIVVNRARDHVE